MKPRFLLDEHIDHSIQRQLRRIDPQVDIIAIGDSSSPPVGTSDSDILLWMEASGYILITENHGTCRSSVCRFAPLRAAKRHTIEKNEER